MKQNGSLLGNDIFTQRYCKVCQGKRQPKERISKKGNKILVCECCGSTLKNNTVWTHQK